jgi:hypothetical protein
MTTTRRIVIFVAALAAASFFVVAAGATDVVDPPDDRIVVIAELAPLDDDGDGFSDGGDAPEGYVEVFARLPFTDGFSDGGDGLIQVFLERAPVTEESDLPPGFVRVLALPEPDGFSDGGDGPIAVQAERADGLGLATVLLERDPESPSPPEGGDN